MNYLKEYVGEHKQISYEELGSALGVTRQQAGNLLAKPLLKWSLERVKIVAGLLNMDEHELFRKALIEETRNGKRLKK